jgi:uncharacterized radical SAM superfamily Fe-S cluster-containing enzyme
MVSTQPNRDLLGETRSVCPICLNTIDAQYQGHDDIVSLVKTCPEHGSFETPVWEGVSNFRAWQERQNPAQAPTRPARRTERGCPYDCGLCERHVQATCCVLLEVTSRCDLHCPVCFASSDKGAASDDPPQQEITGWYDMLLAQGGPFNIQLSGGEPSMRDDLPELIRIGKEKGFTFFQINTNGLRIAGEPDYLHSLASAGLNTVFLQFDSLSSASCVALRGRDLVAEKKRAIENCAAEGLGVVLVPTIRSGVNDGELAGILECAVQYMPTVRGVHFQPMSFFGRYSGDPAVDRITIPTLLKRIEEQSGGQLKANDFLPGGAEHPLCSFHANYTVQDGRWELQKSSGNSGCCCKGTTGSTTSDTARSTVAHRWSAVKKIPLKEYRGTYKLTSLDEFFESLQKKEQKTLAISGMAFQDAWNLDIQRLARCYIHVVSPAGGLIPFCAYNLSSKNGTTLYRRPQGG